MQQSGYCLLRSRFWGRHVTLLFLNGFFHSNTIVEEECCVTTDPENGWLHIQCRRALQHFFFLHSSFEQHPSTNMQEAVHSTDFQRSQLRSQYKTGKDNDGLHTYQVLRKLSSFLLLTNIQQAITKRRKSRKITPCKKCDGVVNFALPWNILEFLLRKAKLHHDGAVTFTGSVTSWKIEYYGKVTFPSSRGCCCVISFEQQKNDGAFLAKFKKCYESRSQYEGGNCCCILSQKCKFTFDLLISQSLSMFWRCSRAATIAVGIWLETIADLFARFWDFRGS